MGIAWYCQPLLILLLFSLRVRSLMCLQLVGISHILGLNIDCSKWEIPEREKKRRRRLWWAVFVQDKW